MASFVDAREAFNGCRRYSATHLQPVFLPLRTFVSSIRGTKDEERERERKTERMWSLIILVGYVGWKLQPTNLLENNEARIVVEIQKGEIRACIFMCVCVCVCICMDRWVDCVLFTFFMPVRRSSKERKLFSSKFLFDVLYIYIFFLSFLFICIYNFNCNCY